MSQSRKQAATGNPGRPSYSAHVYKGEVIEISFGDALPGGIFDEGDGYGPRWLGFKKWIVRHGQAMVEYNEGKIVDVIGASTSSGHRAYLIQPGNPLNPNSWRRAVGRGEWIYGTLKLCQDDVIFLDDERQPISVDEGRSGVILEQDILSSRGMRTLCITPSSSYRVYQTLAGTPWWRKSDGCVSSLTWRDAAALVSLLRGEPASFQDYFLNGYEGTICPQVEKVLGEAGWERADWMSPQDRSQDAVLLLERCELRPEGRRPSWYQLQEIPVGDDIPNRMHRCAARGQVMREEWDLFWETVDLGDDD